MWADHESYKWEAEENFLKEYGKVMWPQTIKHKPRTSWTHKILTCDFLCLRTVRGHFCYFQSLNQKWFSTVATSVWCTTQQWCSFKYLKVAFSTCLGFFQYFTTDLVLLLPSGSALLREWMWHLMDRVYKLGSWECILQIWQCWAGINRVHL